MTIRVTRWTPDTCDCVLEYSWDDTQDENTRTHSHKAVVQRCPEHERLGFGDKGLYDQVMKENTCKSKTFGLAKAIEPTLELDNMAWFFDSGRNLHVVIPALNSLKKVKLQKDSDTAFGAGRVKVE